MLTPTSTLFLLLAAALANPIQPNIVSCLADSGLNIETPQSPSWQSSTTPFNTRFHYIPAAIVYPTQTSDVSKAVRCADQWNSTVSALSGGHSYAASGFGSRDGALIVNFRDMKQVSYPGDGTTIVQPGWRLGDLALELNDRGLALAFGNCPEVGVGGHAAFGGWGLASRSWGLLIDQIVGADLVMANGTTMHVSETEHPELFWGIRGTSSFGIVTQYTMQTHQAPANVTRFAFNYLIDLDSRYPETFAKLMHSYQVWSLTAPKEMGIVTNVWQGGKVIEMAGYYMGPKSDFDRTTEPLLQATGQPNTTYVKECNWITAVTEAAGGTPLNTTGTLPSHDTFYAKSLVVPTSSPLTPEALSALAKYFTTTPLPDPKGSWFVQFELWGGGNSAISSVDPRSTAYPHRHHHWTCQFYGRTTGTWSQPATTWMNRLVSAITDNMQGTQFGAYANYLDPELHGWKEKYYAGNYARLAKMQEQMDPRGRFMKAQNIGAPDV